jgi:hypothetical protein
MAPDLSQFSAPVIQPPFLGQRLCELWQSDLEEAPFPITGSVNCDQDCVNDHRKVGHFRH